MTSGRFDGRSAVVTGGAGGIGRAIAERLHAEGARVAILDRDAEAAERAAAGLGERARAFRADITSAPDIVAALGAAAEELGPPDVLVNNAAYLDDFGTVLDTPPERWELGLAGTLSSVYHCCRCVLPAMVERGGGAIVNVASVLGVAGLPEFSAYMAAKGGVVALTRSLAIDYGGAGVRVNAVSPGSTDTANNRRFSDDPATYEFLTGMTVLGRLGRPAEIAAAVAFLASDDASFVTGVNLLVDGGWTLR